MGRVVLRLCQQRFDVHSQFFRLGNRRFNALVQNQRSGHVGKHGVAVGGLSTEVIVFFSVSHFLD